MLTSVGGAAGAGARPTGCALDEDKFVPVGKVLGIASVALTGVRGREET